ncbi:hypothetical protein FQA39_LY10062 [Lamprigera yunnana]|nr:hypothetical protein FQA39_LY10062 [Lamprigera yunnana]
MSDVLKAAVLDITTLAHNAAGQAEHVVRRLIKVSWNVCHFNKLPDWLQDNDFLTYGHRPPLPSFRACFKSIFRLHTETANIWTHLLGCVAFIGIAAYFLMRPTVEIQLQEKVVFGAFFAGAIICLGFSFMFHTLNCHSQFIGKLFSKLDYCGIALLIMGSFVPWLYYGFYCHFKPKVVYLSGVCALGITSIMVSLWDKFSESAWRPFRAGVFMTFGLSGIVPAIHYGIMEGWLNKMSQKSLGWLLLMGLLYIVGAILYALRVPERFFPGKFDIWLHSHQIFHIFVLGGAFVHFHGTAVFFLCCSGSIIGFQEKLVFGAFFLGAIFCLGFSFIFHTVNCHSQLIASLFSKLDYCGISLLIMGSFVPWVYYGFYCNFNKKVIYLSAVSVLGLLSITVSLWDKFSEPAWRTFRAGVFMVFGLSGIAPAIHYGISEGWTNHLSLKYLGLLLLMGILYIVGAIMYALRIPERFFPGKFDIWLHSHQIFHVFVLGAAFVHYHGISEMAMHRVMIGECEIPFASVDL